MSKPRLIVLAGSNGAGKTSLYETFVSELLPDLPFVNADYIAAQEWPDQEQSHAYDASRLAAAIRKDLMQSGQSFVTETVFSHASKIDLIKEAQAQGYEVWLLFVHVDVELAVARVAFRVNEGGHRVPEDKVRARHERLYGLVTDAIALADRAILFDNSRPGTGHAAVASVVQGQVYWNGSARPEWAKHLLRKNR